MLPAKDCIEDVWTGRFESGVDWPDHALGRGSIARALHRRRGPHVLVTGEPGTGRTTLVRSVAVAAARGEVGFPTGVRFPWVDCSNVGPEDSRAVLETLIAAASGDERPTVLCVDGFDRLLVRPHGGTNKPLVLATAARGRVRFVGILSRWEFEDLVAGDAGMLDLFTRVDVDEPTEEVALAIARHHVPRLEAEYGVALPDEVVERAVTLVGNYCLGEAHPKKGIRVLERACEDAEYDRVHLNRERAALGTDDVVRVIAERTGIPAETIAGESGATRAAGETDFEAALTEAVVGQAPAVRAVANELRLVKAGLVEPGKPASVLLFAGMTGVGKTELAKSVSKFALVANESLVASSGKDGSVRVWQTATGESVHVFETGGNARSLAFDPTGRYLASQRYGSVEEA